MNNLKVTRNKFFKIQNLEDFAYDAMKWRSNFQEENS